MARQKVSLFSDIIEQHTRTSTEHVATTLSEVAGIHERFRTKLEEIADDLRLTQPGKEDARAAAGREALAALEKWHAPLRKGLDAHEQQLLNTIREAVAPSRPTDLGDRLESALLRAEIRRSTEGMSAQELEILYRQGDAHVRRALEELPSITAKNGAVMVRPFVSAELKEEILLEAGRRERPEEAATMDGLRETRQIFQTVAAALKQEVARTAGVAEDRMKVIA